MARIEKRFFKDFTLENLDDTNVASPAEGEVLRYDASEAEWQNVRTDELLILNKKEYSNNVVIPTQTRASLVDPCFSGDIEIEADAILEIAG